MNILLNIFLSLYAIGVFFYPPLYNVGFYGFIILILLHFKKENKLRELFSQFNQKYKLWTIITAIILMAFIGCFYTIAPRQEAFIIFLRRFLTLSTALIFIPFFILHENFAKKIILLFTLSGVLYCIIASFRPLHYIRINPIPISMLIGYIVVGLSSRILLLQKNLFIHILRFVFFTTFLILFNPQKTGFVASIVSIAFVAFIASMASVTSTISIAKKGIFIFSVIVTLLAIGIYKQNPLSPRLSSFFATISSRNFCMSQSVPNVSKDVSNTLKRDSSTLQRIAMQKQCLYIFKTSPFWGNGTASYGSVIKARSLDWISWKLPNPITPRWITTVHPHNDFCNWIVQFGYIGGIFYLIFMGYLLIFFMKKLTVSYLHSFLGLGTVIFFGLCSQCDMMLGGSIVQSVFILGNSICIARIVRKKMLLKARKNHILKMIKAF